MIRLEFPVRAEKGVGFGVWGLGFDNPVAGVPWLPLPASTYFRPTRSNCIFSADLSPSLPYFLNTFVTKGHSSSRETVSGLVWSAWMAAPSWVIAAASLASNPRRNGVSSRAV